MGSNAQRRSTRLEGWDYRTPGAYFVTTVTAGRREILGTIDAGRFIATALGRLVEATWVELPQRLGGGFRLDEWVVMPNHFHAVLWIVAQPDPNATRKIGVTEMLAAFKLLTTLEARRSGHEGSLWQRSFHDRIIRDDEELEHLRLYVRENPRSWDSDPERDQTNHA